MHYELVPNVRSLDIPTYQCQKKDTPHCALCGSELNIRILTDCPIVVPEVYHQRCYERKNDPTSPLTKVFNTVTRFPEASGVIDDVSLMNNVPNRNDQFQERQGINLKELFKHTDILVLTHPQEISCKTGKTELAINYARKFGGRVFWLDFNRIEKSIKCFKPYIDSLEELPNLLKKNDGCLLVIDGAPSLKAVKDLLPSGKFFGKILITTRSCSKEKENLNCNIVQVDLFTENDATKLITEVANRSNDSEEAKTLARSLGYIPSRMVEFAQLIKLGRMSVSGFKLKDYYRGISKRLHTKGNVPFNHFYLERPIPVQTLKEWMPGNSYFQAILYGAEGVGMRSIAHHYALEKGANYTLIWRLPCHDPEAFHTSYLDLGARLGIKKTQVDSECINELKKALQQKNSLIILEDVLDSKLLKYFPEENGHYLMTTQNQEWASSQDHALFVTTPSQIECINYLEMRLDKVKHELDDIPQLLFYHPLLIQIVSQYLSKYPDQKERIQSLIKEANSAKEASTCLWNSVFVHILKQEEKKLNQTVCPDKKILEPILNFCLKQTGFIESKQIERWVRDQSFDFSPSALKELDLIVDERIRLLTDYEILERINDRLIVNPSIQSLTTENLKKESLCELKKDKLDKEEPSHDQTKDVKRSTDLSPLSKNLIDLSGLNEKSPAEIISNPELFWGIFCKKEGILKGSDVGHHLIKKLMSAVEKLRIFFEEGYRNHKVDLLVIEYCGELFFEKNNESLGVIERETDADAVFYNRYLKPSLPDIVRALGAAYSEEKTKKRITIDLGYMKIDKHMEVDLIHIKW